MLSIGSALLLPLLAIHITGWRAAQISFLASVTVVVARSTVAFVVPIYSIRTSNKSVEHHRYTVGVIDIGIDNAFSNSACCGRRAPKRHMHRMQSGSNVDGSTSKGGGGEIGDDNRKLKTKTKHSRPPKQERLGGGSHQQQQQQQQKQKHRQKRQKRLQEQPETWRLYGITTHPDEDDWITLQQQQQQHGPQPLANVSKRSAPIPSAVERALYKRLKMDVVDLDGMRPITSIQIVRRSLDARRKLDHPVFHYVVDVSLSPEQARQAHLQNRPGRTERLNHAIEEEETGNHHNTGNTNAHQKKSLQIIKDMHRPEEEKQIDAAKKGSAEKKKKKKVLVIGAGPAGLFCALQLALSGVVEPILIERGQPVEKRGRDIGALIHRKQLNMDSNFAFGEGGAGTWSDGKLTTRIGRNSANVRWILEKLVEYGAPCDILWEGAPHLGTNNLVKIIRNMRYDLENRGATILFGKKLTNIIMDPNNPCVVQGIQVEPSEQSQQADDDVMMTEKKDGSPEILTADAVVLATGHSARDVYETLARGGGGVCLEPKGFAVGFRIEHPQKVVTKIQYGNDWGPNVRTGKRQTDLANQEYFVGEQRKEEHTGPLPVPSYRLATDKARDGTADGRLRGVYSFCMCPGGQIVLSSTDPTEICVNGMSFSKRDSQWANSALVVTVFPDDPILEPYRERYGVMGGVEFQRDMEKRAATMGGGGLVVPVQRVLDFIDGKVSDNIPSSSYRLGVRSAPCHDIYPPEITEALRDALVNHFDTQMPGYLHPDGLLHGVETRTSSPLRIARSSETLQAKGLVNMFPAGEGAGGIISAAVDGRLVAEAVLDQLCSEDRPERLVSNAKTSLGFQY